MNLNMIAQQYIDSLEESDLSVVGKGYSYSQMVRTYILAYEQALLEAAKVARADKHLLTGMRSAAGEKISEKILQLGNLQDKND